MGHRRAAAAVAPRQRRARGLPSAAQRRQWRRQPRRVAPPHQRTEIVQATPALSANPEAPCTREPSREGSGGAPIRCRRLPGVVSGPIGWAGSLVASSESWSDFTSLLAPAWQVWPDEVTLTFGGAEARSRRRQGEAGGPGSPRPRPDPSHTHSSPPAPHILTCALAAHADQGACCSLCDGGGQGAVPHPHGGCWAAFCNRGAALSRKKLRVFACLRVVVSAWSDFKVEYVVETGQTPTSVAPL